MEHQRLSPEQFKRFSDFIYTASGIRIHDNKVLLLSNRIRRRLKSCDLGSYDDYFRLLKSRAGADEVECFLDVVTTNETFFFRTERHFTWLRETFIPEWTAKQKSTVGVRPLRIWSAACSTGAEPYSIAMCLAQNRFRLKDSKISILATDISQEVLRTARDGKFKSRAVDSVTDRQKRRYFRFLPQLDLWQIRSEISDMVEFRHHNLTESPPAEKFDCIFVCNVLIYFDQQSKQRVINGLLKALNVGGYLVVGPSEGISGMLDSLRKISPLVYQKVASNPPRNPPRNPRSKRGAQP
jgi:chemotaxis protein methyltransferase CheR